MQKIMQKLQTDASSSGQEPAASPRAEAGVGPTDTAQASASNPTTPQAENAQSPGFVADPTVTSPSVNADGGQMITWKAKQLDPALVAFHERYSAVTEQYRSLRARLLNMNPQNKHQIIAITSSLPQEGKSVTTINLGMVMAEGNQHQVLIVDADFRRASMAKMLGIPPAPGLAELISGTAHWADVLRPTQHPNFKVITAGAVTNKNYGELIGSPATRTVMANLREQFDYTFIDTPPVNTVSDVSMLAPHCDGAMLVIEIRHTPEPSVQEAVRTLQTTNVKILGCILSRSDDQRGHYYERYYSYYYNSD